MSEEIARLTAERDEARRERDEAFEDGQADVQRLTEARAQAVGIRARVEAAIAPWPPGVRKGDVLRAIGEGK